MQSGFRAFQDIIPVFNTRRPMNPEEQGSCSYQVLWNAFKRIAAGASASERAALFHDTAARVYRLDSSASARTAA